MKSNPVLSKVKEAIKIAKDFGADSVLAIGGGSVLDSAKVAAGACYDGDVWDFFTGKSPSRALKIFDVITLAATGSEMNSGAVVTREETRQKYAIDGRVLYPKVSIIDSELQASVSREYLVYSASDIIAHSIEGYFTASVQPGLISSYVEANIKAVIKTTEILLANPDDYDARAEFAWAATMALNGLTYVGTGGYSYPNHMIEHAMSAVTDCAHGAGLSVVMPAWMKWYKDRNLAQFERFAREIFGLKGADEGIAAVLPTMQAQKSGQIINISSVAGLKVSSGIGTVYSATKFAVKTISEGLRAESKGDVRVCTIYPGAIATELTQHSSDEAAKAGIQAFYAANEITPDAVARAIVFAVSQPADVDINDITIRPSRQEF